MFLFFFLVIAIFWILKPLRTAWFIKEVGIRTFPLAKMGTALVVLGLVVAYSLVVERFRRERLVYLVSAVSMAALVLFRLLLGGGKTGSGAVNFAFFFFVDSFNTVMVALFWSFLNDIMRPEPAKRLYGFIGAGGILGGLAGSALTGWTVNVVGLDALLTLCMVFLAAIPAIAFAVTRLLRRRGAFRPTECGGDLLPEAPETPDRRLLHAALSGARLVLSSEYLLGIMGIVGLYELVSTVVDFQFNVVSSEFFASKESFSAFLGKFAWGIILASVVIQLSLTSFVHRRLGVTVGLLFLPVALLVGSIAFLAFPNLLTVALLFAFDGSLHYSINQTSKEVLYTPTTWAVKYRAKAFIDMFLFRFSKAVAAAIVWLYAHYLLPRGVELRLLSGFVLLCIFLWVAVARRTGRTFTCHTGEPTVHPWFRRRCPEGTREGVLPPRPDLRAGTRIWADEGQHA